MHERRTYAEASRRPGELSVTEAARELGLHPLTVRRYARDAIDYAEAREEAAREHVAIGLPPPRLPAARRDRCGRHWIPREALAALL
jgi:transposase-like protein